MTLGTYNVSVDPETGLPKAEIQRQRKQELTAKLTKTETLAHLLSQELSGEQGRLLTQAIFEKVVGRLEHLASIDIEIQTLYSLLDALNVKVNIIPRMVREEMKIKLPNLM